MAGFIQYEAKNLLIRQLNIEHFRIPANKPLACCPRPRDREQVFAAGKRM
jgi:hypothetical protein